MLTQLSVHIEVLKKDNRKLMQLLRKVADNGSDPDGVDKIRRLLRDHELSFNQNLQRLKLPVEVQDIIN